MSGLEHVTTPNGRSLEVLTGGAEDGFPLLFHGGTPSAAVRYEPLDELTAAVGLRFVTYSRPGAFWRGRQDAMVPFAHGQWLAAHVSGATAHLFDDEGHLSLFSQLDRLLAELNAMAGR